ncbi:MAG: hypothetical protein ACAF41_29640 [Leptolyngbya sp. BL-A-14]
MSLASKTALEEYARQCTEQRRHYEDSLHQSQQDGSSQEALRAEAMTLEAEGYVRIQADATGTCTEASCMIELLGLPTDPLCWDDSDSVLDATRKANTESSQWQHTGTDPTHQPEMNSTGKSTCSVSYGAP